MILFRKGQHHPTTEQLVLVADREASGRLAARIQSHVLECSACRRRMAQLQGTLSDFIAFHETGIQAEPLAHSRARFNLRDRLTAAGQAHARESSWPSSRQWVAAALALMIVGAGLSAIRNRAIQPAPLTGVASALPRRSLTPGAVLEVPIGELCGGANFQNDPPVSRTLAQAVFHEYGLSASSEDSYELDYLISPTLGGSASLENLWPQPQASISWDAHAKDALENHLHELVCQGKLPLTTAQQEISTDWIEAYKRHFHTEAPLSNAALLTPPEIAGESWQSPRLEGARR